MSLKEQKTLILGIGNYLMGDEGVGVHTALQLQDMDLPDYVEVVDGGTGGFHLLEYFENHEHVILIDATLDGNQPGNIRLIKPRFAKDFPRAMSTHDIGLKDMVSALQWMEKMPDIRLFVVSIESIQQQGIEMTKEVKAVIPDLMHRVLQLAHDIEKEKISQGKLLESVML
ncbi:MAG: hydrogenase maturation protease [Chitinophagaceae bacterium BSSC1]|nr:MAG: hydrogenase maturation protease [Chitinophagaceae bacterium BSSC1]